MIKIEHSRVNHSKGMNFLPARNEERKGSDG